MKLETLVEKTGLDEKHYELKNLKSAVVDPGVYNSLGQQLFELYQKYKIEKQDQRQLEHLSFLMLSFVLEREQKSAASPVRELMNKFASLSAKVNGGSK